MSEQLFYVLEEGKVYATATKWFDKRLLTTLPEKNHEATLAFLHEKFEELDKEVTFLLLEYKNSPDKLKLAGKINRQKNYMATAKAIGDYSRILQPLDDLEEELKNIVEDNIKARLAILDEAEKLKQTEGDWKSKTEKLQDLAKNLRALPLVPDIRVEETKNRLDTIRDEFFASKSKHFEESEKVVLDNLAHKIELCEKAEALAASTSWKETSEEINKLNETWKTIGHVPRHRSEELWIRFNEAKDKFFAKRKEFYGDLKVAHTENLKVKLDLIAKAEAIKDSRDWKKTTEEYTRLMEEWKKSGPVSLEQKDEVWNKFIEAKNHFFAQKDTYYSSIKLNLEDNYARKMAIVEATEAIAKADTVDWDTATVDVLDMVDEWKKIGRIPKEYGDGPWERFLKAKQDFFDRKDAERTKRRAEGGKMLDEKLKRNRGYYNKLKRELDLEEEVLFDFQDRLKNLAPSIKSWETKERYENIIEDAQKKVDFLKKKLQDVKNNMEADEKEFRFITRPFKKKEDKPKEHISETKTDEAKVAVNADSEISTEEKVEDVSEKVAETVDAKVTNIEVDSSEETKEEVAAVVPETEVAAQEEKVVFESNPSEPNEVGINSVEANNDQSSNENIEAEVVAAAEDQVVEMPNSKIIFESPNDNVNQEA